MEGLSELGFEAHYQPKISREQILSRIAEYTGLILRSKTDVDRELLSKADNLVFVARAGAGIEQVDLDELKRRDIVLINAPEGNRDALAEHAIGMILSLSHKLAAGDRQVRSKVWDREGNRGLELKGKTVTLIGYGFMGSALAQRLKAFGCRVYAYDKYKVGFTNEFVSQVDMDRVFSETDILSLHVPLTSETANYFDKSYFNKFRNNITLINTSRGGVLNLNDVATLLEQGKITAVALDVLKNEKINTWSPKEAEIFERLCASDNVLFTPHVGGWTYESYIRINDVILRKIKELFAKRPSISTSTE
jgi:D-3-phosphoglycerate dehydrogenase